MNNIDLYVRPYTSLRNFNDRKKLLVVSSEGTINLPLDLQTFTEGPHPVDVICTRKLPLPDNVNKKSGIDAVMFVYKVFHHASLKTIEESLKFVDARFFTGKCFVLVISDSPYVSENLFDLHQLVDRYSLPMHFGYRRKDKNDQLRLQVSESLTALYLPSNDRRVSYAELNAMQHFNYSEDEETTLQSTNRRSVLLSLSHTSNTEG